MPPAGPGPPTHRRGNDLARTPARAQAHPGTYGHSSLDRPGRHFQTRKRSDLLLSTLRRTVDAMGGRKHAHAHAQPSKTAYAIKCHAVNGTDPAAIVLSSGGIFERGDP